MKDQSTAIEEALRMLDTFASVGANAFDITHTTIDEEKRGFRRASSLADTRKSMPFLIPSSLRRQNNVIVRPHSTTAQIIQLDDMTPEHLAKVQPAVFLILATSPGNHQAWVAVSDLDPADRPAVKEFARRLRKGSGADLTASGATRIAGTRNYKHKYAPDFPTVAIADLAPGRTVTRAQLESMGLVAEAEKPAPIVSPVRIHRIRSRRWPSYEMCLERAPESKSRPGHPRESIADFTWCMTALSWGFGVDETAAHLMNVSAKAQENGEAYALTTAQQALSAVARRHARQR